VIFVRDLSDRTVLVTGGAGFIGSALVRLLAQQNAQVRVVDNLANGKRENLSDLASDQVELIVTDIRNADDMARVLKGADVVYHMACLGVRHSLHSPLENHEVNAGATLHLLQSARDAGVGRFVCVSTSEVYGMVRFTPITEDHPTLTKTVYGASKLAGENYARAFFETYGFPTTIVRPFNAFGPRSHHEGDSGEVIPKFMLRCMAGRPLHIFGDGCQTRDFTYVDDTARGIMLAGIVDAAVGETINLGNGQEISINDLAHMIARQTGREDVEIIHQAPRPGDVLRLLADSRKARELLGYTPTCELSDGFLALRLWYDEQGIPAEQLLEQEVVQNWEGNV